MAAGEPLDERRATVDRPGKTARTRKAKLGCVFTQTTWNKKGYPIRDPDSTTYTGTFETAEEFGKPIYLEAWKHGWSHAERKSSWAMTLNGSGIWPTNYHERQHIWGRSPQAVRLGSLAGRRRIRQRRYGLKGQWSRQPLAPLVSD